MLQVTPGGRYSRSRNSLRMFTFNRNRVSLTAGGWQNEVGQMRGKDHCWPNQDHNSHKDLRPSVSRKFLDRLTINELQPSASRGPDAAITVIQTLPNVNHLISLYISFIVDVSSHYFGLPHLWTGPALECTS